jgi:hypothetical protein
LDFNIDLRELLVTTFITFVLWGVFQYVLGLLWQQATEIFPVLTPLSLISFAAAFLIVFGLWALVNMRFGSVVAVQAYLFFPQNTPEDSKKIEYHQKHLNHRVIVNFKTIPPKAYYLPVGSYPWKLVKRHKELWIPELDRTPNNPDSASKWCIAKGYKLEPRVATRRDLQEVAETNRQDLLDKRLGHVEARMFYHFLDQSRSKTPSKRAILNWETMTAFSLDDWTLNLVKEGKIRSYNVTVVPLVFSVQRWAQKRRFTWSEKLPTMDDLLAQKKHRTGV